MKPSKTSPHTSQFLRDMCRELFDPRYVYCWHGSNDMNDWLLQVEFDKIMFTGSPRVGREIMTAAAQNLTSAVSYTHLEAAIKKVVQRNLLTAPRTREANSLRSWNSLGRSGRETSTTCLLYTSLVSGAFSFLLLKLPGAGCGVPLSRSDLSLIHI